MVLQAEPPDPGKIPSQDVVGVTVVLLTCSYKNQEFIRVGYYVNNEYVDPELKENPPQMCDLEKVCCMGVDLSNVECSVRDSKFI